jgi:hypothetical protein
MTHLSLADNAPFLLQFLLKAEISDAIASPRRFLLLRTTYAPARDCVK